MGFAVMFINNALQRSCQLCVGSISSVNATVCCRFHVGYGLALFLSELRVANVDCKQSVTTPAVCRFRFTNESKKLSS